MSSVIPAVNNYLVNNIVIFDIAYVVCYMYVLYIFLSTFYGEWSEVIAVIVALSGSCGFCWTRPDRFLIGCGD